MRFSRIGVFLFAAMLIFLLPGALKAEEQLTVTVSTDKQTYEHGELITVFGTVLDENMQGIALASVSIQVNDPNGTPIHITAILSGNDGSFVDQFSAPTGTLDGGYTAFVIASKPGYADVNTQTSYTVVPEFSVSSMIWFVVPLFVVLVFLRKQRLRIF